MLFLRREQWPEMRRNLGAGGPEPEELGTKRRQSRVNRMGKRGSDRVRAQIGRRMPI